MSLFSSGLLVDMVDHAGRELKIPNEDTKAAMQELEQGGGKTFTSFKAMIDDLDNDDA